MKNPKDDLSATPKVDMTPMIDVVFQLIIFFMLVIDMTQQDLEDVVLPMSQKAAEDEAEEGRLYVNITRKGEYKMKRQALSLNDLEVQLKVKVDLPRPPKRDGSQEAARDKDGLSTRPILIRADMATEFKHIQKVMYLCGKEGLKIWKVNLAAGRAEEEE